MVMIVRKDDPSPQSLNLTTVKVKVLVVLALVSQHKHFTHTSFSVLTAHKRQRLHSAAAREAQQAFQQHHE